jgi:hypothetical protein
VSAVGHGRGARGLDHEALHDLRLFKTFVEGWMAGMDMRIEKLEARVKQLKAWQEGWDGPQWGDPTPTDAVATRPASSTRK